MPWESTNVRLHSAAGDKLPLADAAIPGKPRWDGDWAGSSLPVLPHAVFIEAAINAGLLIMPCSPHSCLLTLHLVQEPSPCWASRWSLSSMALEVLQGESSAVACSRSPRPGNSFSSPLWVGISIFSNIHACSSQGTADPRAGSWIFASHKTWNVPLIPGLGQSALGSLINPHRMRGCLMHGNIFGIPLHQLTL